MSTLIIYFSQVGPQVQVIANRGLTVTFTAPSCSRAEIEDEIAHRLSAHADELPWWDSPEGANVAVISPSGVWRPRRRFNLGKDGEGE
jgi:hypothetical protein